MFSKSFWRIVTYIAIGYFCFKKDITGSPTTNDDIIAMIFFCTLLIQDELRNRK